jgi:predicted membrane protein
MIKNFIEKISKSLLYFILVVFAGLLIVFLYKNLGYEHFLGFVQVLIWPSIILLALFFFKKVFTYLFFSMEEFNFFGLKGRLKNITEVIEDRVQKRIQEEKDEKERSLKVVEISKELENMKESKVGGEKKYEETLRLANKLLKDYNELSLQNLATKQELVRMKQFQVIKNRARTIALERMGGKRTFRDLTDDISREEIDATVDEYLSNQADINRGK